MNFVMLSGIPRSGSQVLVSALNQHPHVHATTTSPVVDMINIFGEHWPKISGAMPSINQQQYTNMIGGLIHGAYKHIDRSVIVDKNRQWPRFIPLMNAALGHKPKIICTVRPIVEILSSFILLINKNSDQVTYIDKDILDLGLAINTKNRCKILWEKYINHPYTSLRLALNSKDVDICVVSYNDIVENTQPTLDKICNFIGVGSYVLDSNNLQSMDENDYFHGNLRGLHTVRPELKRISPSARAVLGNEIFNYYTSMQLDFWNK